MQVHSFAAARDSRVSHDYIHKIRKWNFRIKGAIKRLNRNRKEFGDATGPSKEQTRREKDEGDEGGGEGRGPFPSFLRSIERIPRGSRGNIFPAHITAAVFG